MPKAKHYGVEIPNDSLALLNKFLAEKEQYKQIPVATFESNGVVTIIFRDDQ